MLRAVIISAAALALAGCAASFSDDQAQHLGRGRASDGIVADVTAESRYGGATISAPVRRAADHLEVRLPGGTWVDCHRSCSETLRRETVDFWQNHGGVPGKGEGQDGPGYFIWRR